MTPEQAQALRKPFPAESIGKLPRAGIQLDYVGHAAVCDRLLQVDPSWTWEPLALAANGTPLFTIDGGDAVMWIHLTICDVTRLGVGIVKASAFELEKQLISDALRNAAMRFGVALDLWSKEDLGVAHDEASATAGRAQPSGETESPPVSPQSQDRPIFPPQPAVSKRRRDKAKSRCVALQTDGVSIADEREKRRLPIVDSCNVEQMIEFEAMLDELEGALAAPFQEPSNA